MASRTANLYILWLWHIATWGVWKLWSPWQSKQENFMVKWMFMVIRVTKMQTLSYSTISCWCLWLHYATTIKHKFMEMWIIQSWNENIATTIHNKATLCASIGILVFLRRGISPSEKWWQTILKKEFHATNERLNMHSQMVQFSSIWVEGEGEKRDFFVFTLVPNVGILVYE